MAYSRSRFLSLVSPCPITGCWWWAAGGDKDGYGRYNKAGAHRVAWVLFRGPIPEGMYVLHRCDRPPCVNPEHLWVGTQQENILDAVSKGRWWRQPDHLPVHPGEEASMAKLTEEDVRYIRANCQPGTRGELSISSFARRYGVALSTMVYAVRGETWRIVR